MAMLLRKAVTLLSTEIGANNAVIAYTQTQGTVAVTSELPGYPGEATLTPLTYTYWAPAALPATYTLTFPEPEVASYIGIAAHSLGSARTKATLEVLENGTWVEVGAYAPIDNTPLLCTFNGKLITRARITLTGNAAPQIGVVYVGQSLRMQRGLYQGHSPVTLSRQTVYRNNVSEKGEWLGRSIVREGNITSCEWNNLTAPWYRAYFEPFVEEARSKPFFLAWRPQSFPEEVTYCWTGQDIRPNNSGPRDLMSVTVTAEGLGSD